MAKVSDILRQRHRRKSRRPRDLRPIGLGLGLLVSLTVILALILLTLGYATISQDLPAVEGIPALLEPPDGTLLEPTRFYDRTGAHVLLTLAHPAVDERQYLALASGQADFISSNLITATITASDPGFWSHPGYTLAGLRAGSRQTLAQRLVAEFLTAEESPGLDRRVREQLLAAQITTQFGREKVLEWFLNSADYGNLAFGVQAASWLYLGKSAQDLSLAEAAVLAPLPEAPALNPLDTPEEAIERQRELLIKMLESGVISNGAFRQAMAEEVTFASYPDPDRDPFAAFTTLARDQLAAVLGHPRIDRGGLQVITTLDIEYQLQGDCTVQLLLSRSQGLDPDSLNGDECLPARLLPQFKPAEVSAEDRLSANAVILDSNTGQILAYLGDVIEGLDPSLAPERPPGSLITPYIHLSAYTRGFSPASLAWDIPSNIPAQLSATLPESDRTIQEQFQGPMRLRTALANDYLVPSLDLLAQIGPENVWRNLPQLGLPSIQIPPGDESLLLPLDEGAISLLEITHAFSAFGNQGVLAGLPTNSQAFRGDSATLVPTALLQVEDTAGQVLLDYGETQSRPILSAQLAYLITDVLSDETSRWLSLGHPNLLEIGRPTGAKIGTTSSGTDNWTIGFTPQLTIGVWAGFPEETSSEVPAEAAPGLWHALIQFTTRDLPPVDWEQPPGISAIDVCDPSGMIPTAECPKVVTELFLNGNEPIQIDTLYRNIQINRETRRLATIFTPPELVEERVFLIVPPEAETWAAETGLPIPPDDYDLIYAPASPNEDVLLLQPEMFAYVRGEVTLRGQARGEDFSFYRLQYGQGLNPDNWIQLGEDEGRAVPRGVLGTWDTSGLSGLYAMQLLVVREDQRVETATIQVTIDNQPPEVRIISPGGGAQIPYAEDQVTTLRVDATDDLALAEVAFFLDGEVIRKITSPPFTVPWTLKRGPHKLQVIATDRAGNQTTQQVSFTVE
jgi:membrane carboxypeptidase/penicillin-binding protein